MSRAISYTGQQKIAILREHLVGNVPVSGVCKKHGISVVNFYCWQKIVFEERVGTFGRKRLYRPAGTFAKKRTPRPGSPKGAW